MESTLVEFVRDRGVEAKSCWSGFQSKLEDRKTSFLGVLLEVERNKVVSEKKQIFFLR